GYFACVYGAGGTISQNLATTPGQSYLLNFYLWVDGQPPFYNPNRVTVQWGSDTVFDQFNVPGNPGGWSLLQVGVVASDPLTTLTLGGYNFQGPIFIDDVSVNPVPVPCTLVLLGSGLLPLLGWRRFRKS
ncbi:MAG: hypothetical protein NTW80_14265, partial [Deltaproteobacteria bacterium]|nr:hypothetical protein [Deltaproteobacteria bacterium]